MKGQSSGITAGITFGCPDIGAIIIIGFVVTTSAAGIGTVTMASIATSGIITITTTIIIIIDPLNS